MKFLIFDMDGVLVDTCGCHARAYQDLWGLCGIEGPPYSQIAGRPTVEVVAEFAPSAASAERVAFKQQKAREYLRSETVVFEDVLPSLAAMKHAGIGMGVATGASRKTAEMLLELAGIADYLGFVLAAEDVRCGKPDPEVYRRAAELAGPDSMVVEDSASGLQAAVAAGLPVACVRSGLKVDSPLFLGSFPGLIEMMEAIGVKTAWNGR